MAYSSLAIPAQALSRERLGMHGFPAVLYRRCWAESLAERGVFDEAIAHAQEAVRLAEALDHPFTVIVASFGLAQVHGMRGELDRAARPAERGRALARDFNVVLLSPYVTELLGYTYALRGRVAEGLALLDEAVKDFEVMGLGAWHSIGVVHLAEACVLAGRLDDARALGARALALTRERGQRGHEAWALRLLGETAARAGPPAVDQADAYFQQALSLAAELGMRPLVAHCHFGLAKLYMCAGQRERAKEHLATATTMYREMAMRFWLEQAEAELKGFAAPG